MQYFGKKRRLNRLLNPVTKRTVIIPLDDSLISGPEEGLRFMKEKLHQILKEKPNSIVGFKGLFKNNYEKCIENFDNIGCVLNLTASTVRGRHTKKIQISKVEEALKMGMDAVAVHVNIGSKYENEMIHTLSVVSNECEISGMPLMAFMYVRKERNGLDYNYEDVMHANIEEYAKLVRHAARIGVDLGADIIKTHYTGSTETFRTVIQSCGSVPVVIAGGPREEDEMLLSKAHSAICAGAAGVCFGRNIFNQTNSDIYVKTMIGIVHKEWSLSYAIDFLSKNLIE